eukprot:jgi/Chrpa1/19036/Chrysochromulina_OHIO_Genome00025714-RA
MNGKETELASMLQSRVIDAAAVQPAGLFSGWSLLHAAASKGHIRIIQMLLTAGASANACNSKHTTPAQLALAWGHSEAAALLHQADTLLKPEIAPSMPAPAPSPIPPAALTLPKPAPTPAPALPVLSPAPPTPATALPTSATVILAPARPAPEPTPPSGDELGAKDCTLPDDAASRKAETLAKRTLETTGEPNTNKKAKMEAIIFPQGWGCAPDLTYPPGLGFSPTP